MRQFFRSNRRGPAVVVLLVLASAVWVRSAGAHQWIVPAAANVAGSAGTNWRTDLRLVSTEDDQVTARIHLLPSGADNSGLDRFVDVAVPARGQVELGNVPKRVSASRFHSPGPRPPTSGKAATSPAVSSASSKRSPGTWSRPTSGPNA